LDSRGNYSRFESMAFIDGTAVNVALPALQKNLQATAIGVQWVVEAYSLFLSALLLVGGSLGDHYGRRRVFPGVKEVLRYPARRRVARSEFSPVFLRPG
jgi:hypothetical protein